MQTDLLIPADIFQLQLVNLEKWEIKSEQALIYKEHLLSASLGEISSNLQLECQFFYYDLNIPNYALLSTIYKYDRLVNVASEAKYLFELYKSTKEYMNIKSLKQFRTDRIKLGFKINFMITQAELIVDLYETFIQDAIKLAKILKSIVNSKKNTKTWTELDLIDKVELLQLIYGRLKTFADLLKHCDEKQEILLNALSPTIDIFKELKDASTIENFVIKCKKLRENQWEEVIKIDFKRNTKILSNRLMDVTSPIYVTVKTNIEEAEAFKEKLQKWKDKVYQGEFIEDADSNTDFIPNKKINTTLDITSVSVISSKNIT